MDVPSKPAPRKWILVVDDDASIRKLLIKVLEQAGYAAVSAPDGATALALIQDLRPHMVILDLRMPRMSGVQCLARCHSIPVLIVSGHLNEYRPDAASRPKVVGTMEKPLDLGTLLAKVREAVEEKGPILSVGALVDGPAFTLRDGVFPGFRFPAGVRGPGSGSAGRAKLERQAAGGREPRDGAHPGKDGMLAPA